MASSNGDGSSSNGTLSPRSLPSNNSSSRDYDTLKQQYDKVNNDFNALRRQYDHISKELDYYLTHHRVLINQLETSKQDSTTLRTKNQILEQDLQTIRNEFSEYKRRQSSFQENGNSESLFMLAMHNEAVREDYDTLRKRYDDLLTSHTQTIAKLEVAQDENLRLSKQYEELSQERNNSLREMGSQKQHLTKAYERMVRDCNKYRDLYRITQQKLEDTIQEMKVFKMKAGKEIQLLKEKRNATMTEYNLVMSERDTVHKEMEKLSDENGQTKLKIKLLEADNKELMEDKQSLAYQMECLRREITSALHDRDKAIKECNDLREKFGGEYASKEDSQYLIKSNSLNLLESADRNKEQPSDSRSYAQRLQRLDNLDQANQELESLRKSLDKTLAELTESKQEAEVSKKRRDWAFSERDKIVQERESIRTLCDNMRKERDRAVSDLAESLRESDAVKKHGNEIGKENKKLKEIIEAYQRPPNTNHPTTTSPTSSLQPSSDMISSMTMDHDEYESDTVLLEYRSPSSSHLLSINSSSAQQQALRRSSGSSASSSIEDLGFELADTRQIGAVFSEECGVYVRDVRKGGTADGRLRVNDRLVAVNGVECGCAMRYNVLEEIRRAISDSGVVRLTVRRRRWSQSRVTRWVHTAKLAAGCHGLSLESGVYIAAISQGSLAAQDKTLVVGDRVLRINNISMGSIDSLHEALSLLNDNRADAVTLTTLKMSYLSGHEQANVFAPAQRYKKENRSSQTESDPYYIYAGQQQQQQHHQHNKLMANSTWLKEKFDMVVGRRPSKDRNRNTSEEKKKYRTSSPLDPNYDQEQALATLDSVLDYHGAPSLTDTQHPSSTSSKQRAFTKKRSSKDKDTHPSATTSSSTANEKNGGTWPKARVSNSLLLGAGSGNAGGTIVHRKRERPPLSLLISEEYYTGGGGGQVGSGMSRGGGNNLASPNNRNSTPVSTLVANLLNQQPPPSSAHPHRRSGVSFDHDYYPTSSSPSGGGAMTAASAVGTIGSIAHHRGPPPPPVNAFDEDRHHMKSDDSLDFPPLVTRGAKVQGGVMTLGRRAETPKYGSDCDRDSDRPVSAASPSGVPPQLHHRIINSSGGSHSHGGGIGPYVPIARPLAFMPHPHPHPHQHKQQQHQHTLYSMGMTVSPPPLQHSHPTTPSPLLPTSSSSPHPSPSSILSNSQQHYPNPNHPTISGSSPMTVPILSNLHNIPPPPRSQSRESFTSGSYDPHQLHQHQPMSSNHALVGSYVPYHTHSHSPSLLSSDGRHQVIMHRQQQQGFSGVVDYGGHQFGDYGGSGGGIGYSHKKEDPRFRVPSTPSLSMLSTTGSIERTINDGGGPIARPTNATGGGSPMPIFHVEVISPGRSAGHSNTTVSSTGGNGGTAGALGNSVGSKGNNRRSVPPGGMMGISSPSNTLLQHQHTGSTSGGGYYPAHSTYYYPSHHHPNANANHQQLLDNNTSSNSLQHQPHHQSQQQPHKPLPGELRRVHIDKSNEPLGIQINCPQSGGIFVSTVNEHSLASRVGLQIGDQLLEVCGINMRNATYNLAANVLRQCGNSITMLVQYSPDKYNELEGSATCSSSSSANDEEDNEPTPCNSPRETRKFQFHLDALHTLSGLSASSRNGAPSQSMMQQMQQQQQSQSASAQMQQQQGQVPIQGQQLVQSKQQQRQSMISTHEREEEEPRYLYIETQKTSNLGITLVGGNAVGIFVHAVKSDSLAYHAGLRTGDQILDYNKSDLRHATAEEAAYELAKPADKVTVLAHYRIDRYNEIQDKPGDSFYVRCGFDRSGSEITDNMQLCFNKDEVLYVDNTMLMYNSSPGYWRAWKLDSEGHREMCGVIPSKYKVEEELLLRRSSGDLESRGSTTARRSFFRRNKKHQRNGSRDSKELASFCVTSGWYSDNGTLHEDLSLCSYQRVEQLDFPEYRPVLVLGPLAEYVVDKLVTDFPDKFAKIVPEKRQSALDEMADNVIVDYRRKGNYFECTTVSAIRNVCGERLHCMLDISISSVEKLHRYQIYPIVLLIKFKSTKQIKEVKDARFTIDKLTGKAAKEMYEHCQKIELEYKHIITAVIPAGVNIAYMCTQVKAAIDSEHNKSQWVTVQ